MAAARAIAAIVADDELREDYIIPVGVQPRRGRRGRSGRRRGRSTRAPRNGTGSGVAADDTAEFVPTRPMTEGDSDVKVTVTGATGLIGPRHGRGPARPRRRGDRALARRRRRARALGAGRRGARVGPAGRSPPAEALAGRDAVVHLAGENVAQRWSDDAKQRDPRQPRCSAPAIWWPRCATSAKRRARACWCARPPPAATGRGATSRSTKTSPRPATSWPRVCVEWEAEAHEAEALGLRVALTRTGVVLAADGGALEKMLPPFKLGVGGPWPAATSTCPGSTSTTWSGCLAALDGRALVGAAQRRRRPGARDQQGVLEGARPRPHRPALAPVPGLALRALYGEMAEIVTTGQRAVPGPRSPSSATSSATRISTRRCARRSA